MPYFRIRSRQVTVRGRDFTMEWVEFPPVVAILPFTSDGRIVLVKQYRAPVDRYTVEIPAGATSRGEPLDQAAHRELAEETGYRAGKLVRLGSFYPAIGYSDEEITIFKAEDLVPGETDFDDGEDIEVLHHTPDEVAKMIEKGVIADSKSILAFLIWQNGLTTRQPGTSLI